MVWVVLLLPSKHQANGLVKQKKPIDRCSGCVTIIWVVLLLPSKHQINGLTS
jgi:hypothetical protein